MVTFFSPLANAKKLDWQLGGKNSAARDFLRIPTGIWKQLSLYNCWRSNTLDPLIPFFGEGSFCFFQFGHYDQTLYLPKRYVCVWHLLEWLCDHHADGWLSYLLRIDTSDGCRCESGTNATEDSGVQLVCGCIFFFFCLSSTWQFQALESSWTCTNLYIQVDWEQAVFLLYLNWFLRHVVKKYIFFCSVTVTYVKAITTWYVCSNDLWSYISLA